MNLRRVKALAAVMGSGAAIALTVIGVANSGDGATPPANLARGDSAVSTSYLPPTIPGMTLISAPAMSTGATVTVAATTSGSATPLAASPSVTSPAVAACSNNGVVFSAVGQGADGCH
jgi:hypothetical protein